MKDKHIPDHALQTIQEELDKLESLEQTSPEYALCRSYLDWLTIIPWGITSQNTKSLKEAEKSYTPITMALMRSRNALLNLLVSQNSLDQQKGSILCFVGPPGVGKTSIGKSIAKALGRSFFRFSVGGMRDEAEIKGHRRTYIGAMPGKIIQALKICQTMNPVIMLDEVDKMSSSYLGDPASALLEVLDPEQNSEFLDHYLDVRCDLSNVLFIVTANVVDTIPEPLLDRMDILRLSGYITEEKVQIAQKYLIPKQRIAAGLKEQDLVFTDTGLTTLIENYAREAGVRSLESNIKKSCEKLLLILSEKAIYQENLMHRSRKPLWKSSSANQHLLIVLTISNYLLV